MQSFQIGKSGVSGGVEMYIFCDLKNFINTLGFSPLTTLMIKLQNAQDYNSTYGKAKCRAWLMSVPHH